MAAAKDSSFIRRWDRRGRPGRLTVELHRGSSRSGWFYYIELPGEPTTLTLGDANILGMRIREAVKEAGMIEPGRVLGLG